MKYGIGEIMAKSKKKWGPVLIKWIDSCASKGWGSRDYHLKEFAYSTCYTTGFLMERTKKYISVCQSFSEDTKNMADTISIPMACVKSVKFLK